MDAGMLRGLFTLVMLVAFAGVVAWAWSRKRKSDFDAAAQLPLEEDEDRAGIPDPGAEGAPGRKPRGSKS